MANTVFILGAGASKQAGAPLMGEFLDVARDLWRAGASPMPDFETVFKGISRLQQVHSKAKLDIHNVESVFAAFEMAKTLGRFSDYTAEQIEDLVSSMRQVILQTIDSTIKLPVRDSFVSAPPPYPEFAKLVSDLRGRAQPSRSAAVITFNYDMGADLAFHQAGMPVDYGLSPAAQANGLPLLKLHGSLNWAECEKCESVVPWELADYFKKYSWQHVYDSKPATMSMGANVKAYMHCDQQVTRAPVIVPPTWNKTEYHRALSSVWSAAARELSEAEDLFIAGYSLPESDAFFRYLVALGTIGASPLRRVWVFDPDDSPELKNRYKALFGPGAEQRFAFFPKDFEEAIAYLSQEFGHTFEG